LRFFIPGQRPELYDFLGAAAAIGVWHLPAFRKRLGTGMIAFLLAGGLAVEGLRPWHFSGPTTRFEWIPFLSMLDSPDWAPTLLVLFQKVAFYGTTVWAIARAGLGVPGATLLTALQLALLEIAQMFLPGRTAESTDPVLALILGVILLQFDRKFGADHGVGAMPAESQPREPSETGRYAPVAGSAMASPAAPADTRAAKPGIWTGGRRRDI
jgi:hypothetical protein